MYLMIGWLINEKILLGLYIKINLGVNYFPHTHSRTDECVSVAIL